MPERPYRTFSKRIVDRLAVSRQGRPVPRSGVPWLRRACLSIGMQSVRGPDSGRDKSKRVTVERHGEIALGQAREEAVRLIMGIKAD